MSSNNFDYIPYANNIVANKIRCMDLSVKNIVNLTVPVTTI